MVVLGALREATGFKESVFSAYCSVRNVYDVVREGEREISLYIDNASTNGIGAALYTLTI